MKVTFTRRGWDDYASRVDDRKTLKRINRLIEDAARDPGVGTGKPELLSGNLSDHWSRRIDQEHRLVYRAHGDGILVISVRFHY